MDTTIHKMVSEQAQTQHAIVQSTVYAWLPCSRHMLMIKLKLQHEFTPIREQSEVESGLHLQTLQALQYFQLTYGTCNQLELHGAQAE